MAENTPDFKSALVSPQVIAALITGIIAIIAAVLPTLLASNEPAPVPTQTTAPPTHTPEPVAAMPTELLPTPTIAAISTAEPIATLTMTATQLPPTLTPLLPTATGIPATDTPPANIILLYDDVAFTIYNDSQQTLSLSGVQFRSANRRWDATGWGASLAESLPPDNCLRMRDAASGSRQPPAICGNLLGFMQVGTSALFWLESDAFEVRYNGELLATCSTADTRCPVYIPQ